MNEYMEVDYPYTIAYINRCSILFLLWKLVLFYDLLVFIFKVLYVEDRDITLQVDIKLYSMGYFYDDHTCRLFRDQLLFNSWVNLLNLLNISIKYSRRFNQSFFNCALV